MQRIYNINLCYLLARQYLLFGFKQFYNRVTIIGKENLPTDNSAIIFAPNHLNAFMDALSVLYILPLNKVVVFLAKSDLFQSKFATSILNFAKILPAYRKIDGVENLGKNNQTFEICIEALKNGSAVGIMPEGGQGEKHQLRPLVKGIFRIAFEAQKQLGETKNVKIVPIGINMSDLIKSSKHIIINIGKPIIINEHTEEFEKNPSAIVNKTKEMLRQSLSDLTLDIASNKYYDSIKFISDVEGYKFTSKKSDKNQNTLLQFIHKQQIINKLLRIQREEPAKMKSISDDVKILQEKMSRLNITPAVFDTKIKSIFELIIGFPVFVFGFITNLLPMFLPVFIRKIIKVEYEGFYSSVHFTLGLIIFPLLYTLQTYLTHKLLSVSILYSIVFFAMQFITRKYTIEWWRSAKKISYKQKWTKNNSLAKDFDVLFSEISSKYL